MCVIKGTWRPLNLSHVSAKCTKDYYSTAGEGAIQERLWQWMTSVQGLTLSHKPLCLCFVFLKVLGAVGCCTQTVLEVTLGGRKQHDMCSKELMGACPFDRPVLHVCTCLYWGVNNVNTAPGEQSGWSPAEHRLQKLSLPISKNDVVWAWVDGWRRSHWRKCLELNAQSLNLNSQYASGKITSF